MTTATNALAVDALRASHRDELLRLIPRYFELGRAEGADGRDHDTPDDAANAAWSRILYLVGTITAPGIAPAVGAEHPARGFEYAPSGAPGIKAALYTDEFNGKQICRDDMWLATTEALNKLHSQPPVIDVTTPAADAEHPAETALRNIALAVSVGGFNSPTVDAVAYEEKIMTGIDALAGLRFAEAEQPVDAWRHLLKTATLYRETSDALLAAQVKCWGTNGKLSVPVPDAIAVEFFAACKARDQFYAAMDAARTPPPAQPVAQIPLADSRVGRVYLAGPMTGYADFNFPAFNQAAAELRANGCDVVNPADHGLVDGAEWGDYFRFDLVKLASCESIALLPGWTRSKGACLEARIATTLGMPIGLLNGAEAAPPAEALGDRSPRYTAWRHLREHGQWPNGAPDWARDFTGSVNDFEAARAVIDELAALATRPPATHGVGDADTKRLDFIENESMDLRCLSSPTGGDDYDVTWEVIEHFMAEPQERSIGFGSTARNAVDDAMEKKHG